MPITRTPRTFRSAALTAALLTAALAAPAGALAATPPTLGPATIVTAGQTSPIDIGGGNNLHRGDTIARGIQLVRWEVTMHGASKTPVTLTCPGSMVQSGSGPAPDGSQVYPASAAGRYYERTVDMTFDAAPTVDPNTAHGPVYLLCRDMKVAPFASGGTLFMPGAPSAVRKPGQRSPIGVPAAHLHRGAKIQRGTQLVRWGVAMFDAKQHALTMSCPRGTVVRGIGMQDDAQVNDVTRLSRYGRNTLKVAFKRTSDAHYNQATASVYVLCASR